MNLMSSANLYGQFFGDFTIVMPKKAVSISYHIHQSIVGDSEPATFSLTTKEIDAVLVEETTTQMQNAVASMVEDTYGLDATVTVNMELF